MFRTVKFRFRKLFVSDRNRISHPRWDGPGPSVFEIKLAIVISNANQVSLDSSFFICPTSKEPNIRAIWVDVSARVSTELK